jgi:hypothetical protein
MAALGHPSLRSGSGRPRRSAFASRAWGGRGRQTRPSRCRIVGLTGEMSWHNRPPRARGSSSLTRHRAHLHWSVRCRAATGRPELRRGGGAGHIARRPGQLAAVNAAITIVPPRPPPPDGVTGPVRRSLRRRTSPRRRHRLAIRSSRAACSSAVDADKGCARLRRWTATGRTAARSTPKRWSGELVGAAIRCSRGRGLTTREG